MRLIAVVIALLAGTLPGAAQCDLDRAKIACEADVRAHCSALDLAAAAFGSYARVIACLNRNSGKISPACRSVRAACARDLRGK